MKTVEMTEEDHAAFEDYMNRRAKKVHIDSISAKMPNTIGVNVKNHITKWLYENFHSTVLAQLNEAYNPLPIPPRNPNVAGVRANVFAGELGGEVDWDNEVLR